MSTGLGAGLLLAWGGCTWAALWTPCPSLLYLLCRCTGPLCHGSQVFIPKGQLLYLVHIDFSSLFLGLVYTHT